MNMGVIRGHYGIHHHIHLQAVISASRQVLL